MNSIGLSMNSCGKMSATPAVSVCRLRAELVSVKKIRFAAQTVFFFYAAGTTQKQSPSTSRSVSDIFQTGLILPIDPVYRFYCYITRLQGRVILCNPSFRVEFLFKHVYI